MAEHMDERELERTLAQIGRGLPPPSRDLWPLVRARIASGRKRPWWPSVGLPRFALAPALVTLLVLAVAAIGLTTNLVADAERILGLRGVQIFKVPETPTPPPSTQASPVLFTGTRALSVADASKIAGFVVQAPAALGDPDAIYVDASPTRVTLVFSSRPGIPPAAQIGVSALVVEIRGAVDQQLMGKAIGPGTTLEPVEVSGAPGFWLAGSPHLFFLRDANGVPQMETLRLAENTLLWERGGVTYRLEAQVTRDEAIRIASSFR
ncbi:MAG: hypothetical protein E6I64_01685 [Chloroflexi bacterium]|nr:MAG: hypothetical protein E6I64_01685 [Chloroflexota bacterium]